MSTPASTPTRSTAAAWQAALAAEHRAYFAYGLLGPQLAGAERQLAHACASAHATLRDATSQALLAAGLTPVPTAADYPSLYPVRTAAAARTLAARVEDDCAAAWRYLYAQTSATAAQQRTAAQSGLTASAVRAARWRVLVDPSTATQPFPGI